MKNSDIKPLLSIIIPCYNSEKHISKTLESVLNQRYENLELIIVNDGSTDNTVEVVKDILKTSILDYKIITQQNQGVSCARNKGILNSTGEYICFLDSDDLLQEDFITNMIDRIIKDNLDLIFCGCDIIKGIDNIDKYENYYKYLDEVTDGKKTLELLLKEEIQIWTINMIIRKHILLENNIKFESKSSYAEDVEFIYKTLFNCNRVNNIKKSMVFYNRTQNSAMSTFSTRRLSSLGAMNRLRKYFKCRNSDKIVNQLIDNRLCREIIYICNSYITYGDLQNKYMLSIIDNILYKYKKRLISYKIFSTKDIKIYIKIVMLVYLRPMYFKKIKNSNWI